MVPSVGVALRATECSAPATVCLVPFQTQDRSYAIHMPLAYTDYSYAISILAPSLSLLPGTPAHPECPAPYFPSSGRPQCGHHYLLAAHCPGTWTLLWVWITSPRGVTGEEAAASKDSGIPPPQGAEEDWVGAQCRLGGEDRQCRGLSWSRRGPVWMSEVSVGPSSAIPIPRCPGILRTPQASTLLRRLPAPPPQLLCCLLLPAGEKTSTSNSACFTSRPSSPRADPICPHGGSFVLSSIWREASPALDISVPSILAELLEYRKIIPVKEARNSFWSML
ncbi:PREDICTED: uncharacterized protein LOC102007509 [Chinchilla lanigera]|uniref:uncharacterized protein LOC102007509 n=1 Tax=Chinchilla lanigera TaxID=34839 RepID=UPI00069676A4|nr:PREDICTED: uncharacterized protein LOC102007509 [Chinchilla lanigera]